jgi:hypothetical protein
LSLNTSDDRLAVVCIQLFMAFEHDIDTVSPFKLFMSAGSLDLAILLSFQLLSFIEVLSFNVNFSEEFAILE